MLTNKQVRQLCADIGIDDDRAEAAIVEMSAAARTELQLERDKVPEQVWALEDKLMEMGAKV